MAMEVDLTSPLTNAPVMKLVLLESAKASVSPMLISNSRAAPILSVTQPVQVEQIEEG
jgi:hypothetical protein